MEINHYGDTILPVVAASGVYEGRFVLLASHSFDHNFGSLTDLPGARHPATAAESLQSRYVAAWPESNMPLPIIVSPGSYDWALRYGWDQVANTPFNSDVYLEHPANMEVPPTMPNGLGFKAYGEGLYTIPSGTYMYNVLMETPGCQLSVANTAVDGAGNAGKLKYLDGTTGIVAETYFFDTDTSKLTFKILH